jgi:epoxyqueuosine reductase
VIKLRQEELRRRLVALGFDEVRFARMADVPAAGLTDWLARGFHADMCCRAHDQ